MDTLVRAGLTATVVLAASAASAQTPLRLTLEAAIQRGVAHAPRLAEARAHEAAAEAASAASATARVPTVTVLGGYLRTNHVDEFGVPQPDGRFRTIFPDIPDNYRARTEMALPVITSGRVEAAVRAAEAEVAGAGARRRGGEADLRLEIARAYWLLVTARARVVALEAAQARTDAWVRDIDARVDAGFLPPNDLLSARAERARQAVRLVEARHEAAVAELELGRLVGVDPGTALEAVTPVDRPDPAAAAAAAAPVEDLVARALAGRAERDGLRASEAAWRARADAALASRRPLVAAVAAVEPGRPNPRFVPRADRWNTSWDLGVTVTWPLWDGGRARADAAAADAGAAAARHRLADFDGLVQVEVRRRRLDVETARAALAAAEDGVAAVTEAHRVVSERFTAGVAVPSDVLEAQAAVREADLERIRLAVTLRLAEARLLHAIGEIR